MGFFNRRKQRPGQLRVGTNDDFQYLADWSQQHQGVEAFVEPQTTVTDVTVVLVAADGQWTRRRVGGEQGARRLAKDMKIPVYDVNKTGYPQRMRDYDARQRILRQQQHRAE